VNGKLLVVSPERISFFLHFSLRALLKPWPTKIITTTTAETSGKKILFNAMVALPDEICSSLFLEHNGSIGYCREV